MGYFVNFTRRRGMLFAAFLCLLALAGAVRAEEEAEAEAAKVQGRWRRTVKTDRGVFEYVKEHRGDVSTLTMRDPAGNIVAAKRSKFRLESAGKVRIFTFFDNVATAGPDKGKTDAAAHSYVYRVTRDKFFEVNGLLADDVVEPSAIVWERLPE